MAVKSTKTTTKKKTESKAKAVVEPQIAAAPLDSDDASDNGQAEMLKKPEFLDMVMERIDVKKRDAKPSIEAALAVLGDTLASGRDVNVSPLGRFKVVKSKDHDSGGQILTLKLRIKPESDDDTSSTDTDDDEDY